MKNDEYTIGRITETLTCSPTPPGNALLHSTGFSADNFIERVSPDEHNIVEFLKGTPDFISVIKISLKVGGRKRCRSTPCWARQHLLHLSTLGLLEADGKDRFRLKAPEKVHLAPQIADIFSRAKARFAALFG